MDQIKIGKFIAEMRKEQNMTQKQLAELLNISDKTISKWECGKGMPDNSILLELCEALHINVNELLSGSTKHFFYSFVLYVSNHPTVSKEKVHHCLLAVKLMLITILLAGGFSTMVGIIATLAARVPSEVLGVNIAVTCLSLLYSLILDIFLLPIWKKLHTMLIG